MRQAPRQEHPPRPRPPYDDEDEGSYADHYRDYDPPPPPAPQRTPTVTRVAAARTRELTGRAVRRINAASRAEGAGESGLTSLIWTNAIHFSGDAMIAVCLAGTIFFSAATSDQKSGVALYLLITIAPFALVAPFLGPLLDRMHHGRRVALAGTMVGRAVLAYVMADNFDNFALYPAAFGALVLSKAYGVLKGACVPRVLPEGMTLVSANSRLSLFGLASSIVAGGTLAGFIKITDSYPWALRIAMAVFLLGALQALRLPPRVDSAAGEVSAPVMRQLTSTGAIPKVNRGIRLSAHVVTALRCAGTLRGMAGFLTLFMAFYIKRGYTGLTGVLYLGALAGAMAVGSVVGTAIGARLKMSRPDAIVLLSVGSTASVCVVAAMAFSMQTAVLVAAVGSTANSLGKLCLDAIVQREVPDAMRASAFGRSETVLQLSWVLGGGLGIALPADEGRLAFAVAAALLVLSFVLTVLGRRSYARNAAASAAAAAD